LITGRHASITNQHVPGTSVENLRRDRRSHVVLQHTFRTQELRVTGLLESPNFVCE
jgi:hypothetical protein